MDDSRPSLLLKANREIAEVREALARVDGRVDEIQAKNANYLEEISLLDTEVSRLCARTAVSEQKLAETFEQKRRACELRAEKQAAQSERLAHLREELREHQEALEEIVVEPVEEVAEVLASSASNLRVLESKESAQRAQVEAARQRLTRLKEEVAAERAQQQELHRGLRKAVEDRESSAENEQALKAAIMASGGDPAGEAPAARSQALRSELAAEEEKCHEMRRRLAETAVKGQQEVESLEKSLSDAREDLQRSLAEVFSLQRQEAAQLESRVKAERQRANIEAVGAENSQQRVERLQQKLQERRTAPQGMGNLLREEIRRTQQQALAAERQAQERVSEQLRLKQQELDIKARAADQAAEVKAKIQEIWRAVK